MSIKVILVRENDKRRCKMIDCSGMNEKEIMDHVLNEIGIVNEDEYSIEWENNEIRIEMKPKVRAKIFVQRLKNISEKDEREDLMNDLAYAMKDEEVGEFICQYGLDVLIELLYDEISTVKGLTTLRISMSREKIFDIIIDEQRFTNKLYELMGEEDVSIKWQAAEIISIIVTFGGIDIVRKAAKEYARKHGQQTYELLLKMMKDKTMEETVLLGALVIGSIFIGSSVEKKKSIAKKLESMGLSKTVEQMTINFPNSEDIKTQAVIIQNNTYYAQKVKQDKAKKEFFSISKIVEEESCKRDQIRNKFKTNEEEVNELRNELDSLRGDILIYENDIKRLQKEIIDKKKEYKEMQSKVPTEIMGYSDAELRSKVLDLRRKRDRLKFDVQELHKQKNEINETKEEMAYFDMIHKMQKDNKQGIPKKKNIQKQVKTAPLPWHKVITLQRGADTTIWDEMEDFDIREKDTEGLLNNFNFNEVIEDNDPNQVNYPLHKYLGFSLLKLHLPANKILLQKIQNLDNTFPLKDIEALIKYLPNNAEYQIINGSKGIDITSVIAVQLCNEPYLTNKLTIWYKIRCINIDIDKATTIMTTIADCLNTLQSSQELLMTLKVTLNFGNILNASSPLRCRADAFSLEALLLLKDVPGLLQNGLKFVLGQVDPVLLLEQIAICRDAIFNTEDARTLLLKSSKALEPLSNELHDLRKVCKDTCSLNLKNSIETLKQTISNAFKISERLDTLVNSVTEWFGLESSASFFKIFSEFVRDISSVMDCQHLAEYMDLELMPLPSTNYSDPVENYVQQIISGEKVPSPIDLFSY
ncbi:formin family protein [Entamoeba histolytica HM-1:IMSS-B]|uniref:Formin homology 2 domain containing protein n=5 Tax=Entamoeba histolytica TaxID=5759 RepID=C4LVE0_ENTH1|nr:formin homology 2 domain containing protein [Entamoeba histolytica HM-1:IMSS]EMD49686.1 formin 2 domain containing protein [Entamoeba histolytica KU27]EMH72739.1 formin family protein [Entamoeba histolytica HM-1:IMSS-B]ENY63094.1 formin 2 domain containing family protein [Entamoeba histolytica HM-1:IMSS-A]GAT92628.1 formin homology 2 family protein [Entamoeba histolytica]EAL48595.1 formin homology 2 domain containing protein [Entamoeba histolytica HM-1:IMSS]|eukprot:XP_653981.1 formin homology 2 domain containing protein [Entamoeba histolytica HM-1:IMSS]